jgi:hypothetical protein
MKKTYIFPETKISEFKGKQMLLNESGPFPEIDNDHDADDSDALTGRRGDDWGSLWN